MKTIPNPAATPLVMRAVAAQLVHRAMAEDPRVVLLIGDLGYKMWDRVRQDYPRRVFNTGAAEQTMIGTAVGMALGGKIPLVYSITPFLIYRPFETIRNYLNYEKIPVKLLASGRDRDYQHDGISHWSEDDRSVLSLWPNIKSFWPDNNQELAAVFDQMFHDPAPYYINLTRK
jgi:transketolase